MANILSVESQLLIAIGTMGIGHRLGKKKYGSEVDFKANAQRSERAKKQEQLAIPLQECEVAEKRQKLNESSHRVAEIDFGTATT